MYIAMLAVERLPNYYAKNYSGMKAFFDNTTLGFQVNNDIDGQLQILCVVTDQNVFENCVEFLQEPAALIAHRKISKHEARDFLKQCTENIKNWLIVKDTGEFLLQLMAELIAKNDAGYDITECDNIINKVCYMPLFKSYIPDSQARQRNTIQVVFGSLSNTAYHDLALKQIAIVPAETKHQYAAIRRISGYEREARVLHQERWDELINKPMDGGKPEEHPDKANGEAFVYVCFADAESVSTGKSYECLPVGYIVASNSILTGSEPSENDPPVTVILSMCVLPHFRRLGIGVTMLRHLLRLLTNRVEIPVPESCLEMSRLLTILGFEAPIIMHTANEYDDPDSVADGVNEDLYIFAHNNPQELVQQKAK